jgi:thymidylate synthase (FAD)
MKIIEPSYEIITPISKGGIEELKNIERIGRTCYKSEDKIADDGSSAMKFVRMLIRNGHESVIEHGNLTVRFTVDRGITHEIVRHRIAAYSQESTRYCNYSKGKFGSEITVIRPYFLEENSLGYNVWEYSCETAENAYISMLNNGYKPEEARGVLPTSLAADLVMTANYREWRHFLKLRCSKEAHPQIRQIAVPLLQELQDSIPVMFEGIDYV